jgi:hypothetical protein
MNIEYPMLNCRQAGEKQRNEEVEECGIGSWDLEIRNPFTFHVCRFVFH